jgi:hypothetical protein
MLPPSHKLREIIEESQFTVELQEIEPDAIRADEFVDGAKWVLSRNPEYGTKIGQLVWFIPMLRSLSEPSMVLYYTFDADRVFLLSIQIAADEQAEE